MKPFYSLLIVWLCVAYPLCLVAKGNPLTGAHKTNIQPQPLQVNAAAVMRGDEANTGNNLLFIENKGQVKDQDGNARPDIQYKLAATGGLNIFIGNAAIHYQFHRAESGSGKRKEK